MQYVPEATISFSYKSSHHEIVRLRSIFSHQTSSGAGQKRFTVWLHDFCDGSRERLKNVLIRKHTNPVRSEVHHIVWNQIHFVYTGTWIRKILRKLTDPWGRNFFVLCTVGNSWDEIQFGTLRYCCLQWRLMWTSEVWQNSSGKVHIIPPNRDIPGIEITSSRVPILLQDPLNTRMWISTPHSKWYSVSPLG